MDSQAALDGGCQRGLTIRSGHLALAAVAATLAFIYCSLLPLQYEPLAWSETLQRFRQTPMLAVGIDGRADFVANGLLLAPAAFLWTGALALGGGGLRSLLAVLAVIIAGSCLAIALEMLQLWFPARTVSRNDILSEVVGVIAGSALWHVAGERTVAWLRAWRIDLSPREQLQRLLTVYAAVLCLYMLMPLDVIISFDELRLKADQQKLSIVSTALLQRDLPGLLKEACRAAVFVPLGALFVLRGCQSAAGLLWRSVLLTALLEACQVLIYSRFASFSQFALAAAACYAGGALALPLLERLRSGSPIANCRTWFVLASLVGYVLLLTGLFWWPLSMEHDPDVIQRRWNSFFAPLGAALYRGTEFNAIRQILTKLLLFGLLGVLAALASISAFRSPAARKALLLALMLAMVAHALLIEVGQVWLKHGTPDITDCLLYIVGGMGGILLVLRGLQALHASRLAPNSNLTVPSACRSRGSQ